MWADFSSETKRPKGGSIDAPTVSLSQGSQQRNTHIPLSMENLLDIRVPAAPARDSCIWHKGAHFAFVRVGNFFSSLSLQSGPSFPQTATAFLKPNFQAL